MTHVDANKKPLAIEVIERALRDLKDMAPTLYSHIEASPTAIYKLIDRKKIGLPAEVPENATARPDTIPQFGAIYGLPLKIDDSLSPDEVHLHTRSGKCFVYTFQNAKD